MSTHEVDLYFAFRSPWSYFGACLTLGADVVLVDGPKLAKEVASATGDNCPS